MRTQRVSRVQERVDKLMSIAGARLDALRTDGVIGTGKRTGAKRAVSERAHVPRHGQQAHCPAQCALAAHDQPLLVNAGR